MALNCSSSSVFPAESRGAGCDNRNREVSAFSSGLEKSNAYWHGGWDCLGLPCLSDWEISNIFGYGEGENEYMEWDSAYDPISQLPDDPFEQNASCDITAAAIAAGFVRFGARSSGCEVNGGDFVACYCWDDASLCSPEAQFSKGDGFWDEIFSSMSIHEAQDRVFESVLDMEQLPGTCCDEGAIANAQLDDGIPHDGFMYVLGYLGVNDLLSMEGVCKSLRSMVQNDSLLWRCIHIDSFLSEKITDDALLRLTERAQGNLQCLSLTGCSRITDEGLRNVLENNPKLRKLSVPECVRLSLDGLINNLKAFQSAGMQGIKCLKLGRLFSVSEDQFGELKKLLGMNEVVTRKTQFYHNGRSSITCHDECPIDIDICPLCQKYKLVYDCTSNACQAKGSEQCRGCDVCIARCIQCGKCIKDSEYVETFFLEYLCSGCWKNPSICPEINEDMKE